ncbi:MAG: hypothetical protein AUI48_14815 [Chloroflexi bacterium 13_1_40CM_2_68_14]|nr:MAG: hypothetical protein AUI90_07000 [Deltaproteobacteria bacterium 13_1_40CM_3_69_14]OLD45001.1 MAG: hypothetical protein AUI48_14815 [Chloroflexi bacterium 13_1_40CM_2_68_14]
MLTIRDEQLEAFERASWKKFEQSQLGHVREYFPVDHAVLGGDRATLEFIRAGIERARAAGISVFGDACRYVDLMLSLGTDFVIDPQLPWAKALIDDESQDVSTRVDLLHAAALAYIDRVAGEDGGHYLRAVLRARSLSYEEASADDGDDFERSLRVLCARLWPRKHREIRGDPMPRFLARAIASSERDGMGEPGPRMIYAGLMFLLGSGFATDPLHRWATAVLSEASSSGHARAHSLFDAAKDHLERTLEAIRSSGSD